MWVPAFASRTRIERRIRCCVFITAEPEFPASEQIRLVVPSERAVMTRTIPDPVGEEEIRDIADERQIRRLLSAYVDAVNRSAWDEFDGFFLPAAKVEVSRGPSMPGDTAVGPAAVGEMIGGFVSAFDFLIQVVLNARIQLRVGGDPDAAFARVTIAEYRQLADSGRFIESSGVYHDHYVRRGGRWWFARRRYERTYATAPTDVMVHSHAAHDDPPITGV